MKPIELELVGFTGIRSGSGLDSFILNLESIPHDAKIVALSGKNGIGKTTLMDNLHPYRLMPSRSNTMTVGGFSYWDNICLPEARKRLIWEHNGKRYQSDLIFKNSGKTNKTEAYLSVWNSNLENWEACSLSDGTKCDGKTSTYDLGVEEILGSSEAFFLSNFSAQKRKSIASYTAGEFKPILGSILGLENLSELSEKASMVGKLLKFRLTGLQEDLSQSRVAEKNIADTTAELELHEAAYLKLCNDEVDLQSKLNKLKQELASLESKQEAQAKESEQRTFLESQLKRIDDQFRLQQQKIQSDTHALKNKLQEDRKRIEDDLLAKRDEIQRVKSGIARYTQLISQGESIKLAVTNQQKYQAEIDQYEKEIAEAIPKIDRLRLLEKELNSLKLELGSKEQAGTSKSNNIIRIKNTASLVNEVPCVNLPLQSQCSLLREANEAKTSLPTHEAEIAKLRESYKAALIQATAIEVEIAELLKIESQYKLSTAALKNAIQQKDECSKLALLIDTLTEAIQQLPESEKLLETLCLRQKELNELLATTNTQIQEIDAKQMAKSKEFASEAFFQKSEIQTQLDKLELPIDPRLISECRLGIQAAEKSLDQSKAMCQKSRDQKVTLLARIETFKDVLAKTLAKKNEAERLSDEIAKFKLIEKGIGSDGLIALSIDDAGPEISAICNDLMKECFGGRFSVRIDTQTHTKEGNARETFQVVVFDNHRGEEKLLKFVSGGEEVWIEASLIRAMALYKNQCSGQNYQTLFSDEADGALDPSNKRNFLAMKRYVLNRGGYEREYFITHTPELLEIADHIVDVAALYQ